MGTQQLLLIVLGVIIVGTAISVGIGMFNAQAYNANRQALMVQFELIKVQIMEYWNLPVSMGGAGKNTNNVTIESLASYIGFSPLESKSSAVYSYATENGEFRILGYNNSVLSLQALGIETKNGDHPLISMDIDFLTQDSSVEVAQGRNFNNGVGGGNGGGQDGNNGNGNDKDRKSVV